jgi:predicted HTH transcriptional regulator
VVGEKKPNKGNRVEAAVMNSIVPISKREINTLLPDVSQTMIEAKLAELLKSGKIKKVGSKKDARYIRK